MPTFKAYSEKSKARRALVQVHQRDDADDYLVQKDGKWGFYIEGGFPVIEDAFEAAEETVQSDERKIQANREFGQLGNTSNEAKIIEALRGALATAGADPADAEALLAKTGEQGAEAAKQDVLGDEEAPSAFGMFSFNQLTNSTNGRHVEPSPDEPKTVRTTTTKGQKIEKDRVVQNGVQIPSTGTLCRAVWDTLTAMMTAEGVTTVPTAKDIKAVGVINGWNANNVSIEYYRWRKFNGITGHGKKTV